MKDFNAFQTLSVVGLIFSVVVQVTLILIDKTVHTIWALYPAWAFVFLFGYLVKKYSKDDDHHHHH